VPRDKDHAVLHQIQIGNTDVQQITSATTLSNREVNYCFEKLEELGLIEVEKLDGMVEHIIDG
jgi:predicted transcriptional regulator